MSDKDKNAAVLDDFVRFCHAHPGLRFWQALAAWSGSVCVYALRGGTPIDVGVAVSDDDRIDLRDTFNWEGKDG